MQRVFAFTTHFPKKFQQTFCLSISLRVFIYYLLLSYNNGGKRRRKILSDIFLRYKPPRFINIFAIIKRDFITKIYKDKSKKIYVPWVGTVDGKNRMKMLEIKDQNDLEASAYFKGKALYQPKNPHSQPDGSFFSLTFQLLRKLKIISDTKWRLGVDHCTGTCIQCKWRPFGKRKRVLVPVFLL